MAAHDVHRTLDAVWRIESAKIIGGVARLVRDVGLAEEIAQETLLTALERWPEIGVPDNPGAWLMAAAKNRALDHFRHAKLVERKHEELGHEVELRQQMATNDASTGLDDWEWGVTLWGRSPQYLKDIVYTMRFDTASARYAEFGPFYVSYIMPPADALGHLQLT